MQVVIRTINKTQLPPGTKIGQFNVEKLADALHLPPMAVTFIKMSKPTIELSLDLPPWVNSTGYYDLQ